MNIFQISQELLDIFAELEENGGELTEELEAQLAVSQADFKSKVKSYGDVIKYTESEIDLIDKEIARLKELKESKNKAIARLEKIIIRAVDMFGETTKSGGRFVDYGTGKISIRNTEKVEVNTEITDSAVISFLSYIGMLQYSKELDNYDGIDITEALHCKTDEDVSVDISPEEFNTINASFTFDIPLKELTKGKGFEFIRHFIKYVNNYKAKSSMSKTELKNILKENINLPHIADIVQNKTVNIK